MQAAPSTSYPQTRLVYPMGVLVAPTPTGGNGAACCQVGGGRAATQHVEAPPPRRWGGADHRWQQVARGRHAIHASRRAQPVQALGARRTAAAPAVDGRAAPKVAQGAVVPEMARDAASAVVGRVAG